jgi:hypothetical protein
MNAKDGVALILVTSACKKRWPRQNMASFVSCSGKRLAFTMYSVKGTKKA